MTLDDLLNLMERWQQGAGYGVTDKVTMDDYQAFILRMHQFDVKACRARAEQYAAQLREHEKWVRRGFDYMEDERAQLLAAADFLCAPRREPEAE